MSEERATYETKSDNRKRTISRETYAMLVGLEALARRYRRQLEDCEAAAVELLGTDDLEVGHGHVIDCIGGGVRSVDEMLRLLGIEVADGE